MDFNSIFKVFLPKDRVFFQLFEEVAERVNEMGIKLKEMAYPKKRTLFLLKK